MKKKCIAIIAIIFFLLTQKIVAQKVITFESEQLHKGDTCALYHYKNGMPVLLKNTIVNEPGKVTVTDANTVVLEGIYTLMFSSAISRGPIQILYSKEEKKTIEGRYFEHNQNMVFKDSEQNTAFEAYLQAARNFYKTQHLLETDFYKETDSIERKKIRDKAVTEQQMLYDYGKRISDAYSGSVVERLISCVNTMPIPGMAWSKEYLSYGIEDQKYQNAVSFLKQHYWEGVSFTDSMLLNTPYLVGKTNYYMSLYNPKDNINITKAIDNLLERAAVKPEIYHVIEEVLLNLYLLKNSNVFDEEMGIYILRNEQNQIFTPEWRKDIISARISYILKNKLGTIAADLTLENQTGKKVSPLQMKSKYTVLYFFNPDCSRCMQISPIVKDWLTNNAPKDISFLAIYVDNNETEWRKYIKENNFPQNWQNLWGNKDFVAIRTQYWIDSIPAIYLLDENKKVLLKDVNYKQLMSYFAGE